LAGHIVTMIRRIASLLPTEVIQELRRLRFLSRAKRGNFHPNEPEANILSSFVSPGDWVIDIGANVGQYSLLLSGLVGQSGRVLAFEPILNSASTLASVAARYSQWQNISVLNLAVSDKTGMLFFDVPVDGTGLQNYERAQVKSCGATAVLGISIDSLNLPRRISLAKIDAEGHENEILAGMRRTIERDLPTLIVEDNGEPTPGFLVDLGYLPERKHKSPNIIFASPGLPSLRD
jgi:FkbM family methyltransferase